MKLLRRWMCLWSIVGLQFLSACGGGGGSGEPPPPLQGSLESRSITSAGTGTTYPLSVYLPPASAGARSSLPVVYALDGESWFGTLVDIAESTGARIIIVAVGSAAQRSRDFVPPNNCTPGGGGHGAYLEFVRSELIPYVENAFGGSPARRALLGHSHGGSFVLYAMFAQAPGQHLFSAYLSSDASVSCMTGTAVGWEQTYAAAHGADLPVRLHMSYATQGNFTSNQDYAAQIGQRSYTNLVFTTQTYTGSHNGIVPAAYRDALSFAFPAGP